MAVKKKLLLVNTFVSYFRTIVNVCVTLFTTRWVMAELGVQDYGLYFLAGGAIAFVAFFNTALLAGSYRFIAHAVDRSDQEVSQWFSTSFYIHLLAVGLILIASYPLYIICFNWVFEIPKDRFFACSLVYWVSVLMTSFSVINVPFAAMYTAYQRIFEVTLLNLLNTFLVFALAYGLRFIALDKLIVYAVGYAGIHALVYVIQILRCLFAFKTARLIKRDSIPQGSFKKLVSFSWWSFLDSLAFMLRNYGVQVIFNRSANVNLNAAYSVSQQLATQSHVLSGALTSAMSPGIISQFGVGDKKGACEWGLRTCKIATILSMLVVVPLFFECETVLKLWLGNVPDWTVCFTRVMVVMCLITQWVTGLKTIINANGEIRRYQILTFCSYLIGLMYAVVVYILGLHVAMAIYGVLLSTILYALATLTESKRMSLVAMRTWVLGVFVPSLMVLMLAILVGVSLGSFIEMSCLRIVLTTICVDLTILISMWFVMLQAGERGGIVSLIARKLNISPFKKINKLTK